MEKKSKSEKLIFWGFILLAISFFGLVYYFQYQSNLLSKREELVAIQEIQNKNLSIEKDQLVKLVPSNLQSKVDSLRQQTNQTLKENIETVASSKGFENSIIYIQVGSNETKLDLQKRNFDAILNSKGYNVINDYELMGSGVDNTIRYFNGQDKNVAENLRNDILKCFPDIVLTLKPLSGMKAPIGQLEIWIK